jgi:hypothetical protein
MNRTWPVGSECTLCEQPARASIMHMMKEANNFLVDFFFEKSQVQTDTYTSHAYASSSCSSIDQSFKSSEHARANV